MASSQFLEEALSQEIDESAVSALVGTLEGQLESAVEAPGPPQPTPVTVLESTPASPAATTESPNNGLSNGQITNGPSAATETNSDSGKTLTPLQNAPTPTTVVLGSAAGAATPSNIIATKTSDGAVKLVAFPASATTGAAASTAAGLVNLNQRTFVNGAVVNKTVAVTTGKPAAAAAAGVQVVNVRPAGGSQTVTKPLVAATTANQPTVGSGATGVAPGVPSPSRFVINSPVLRPGVPGAPFTLQSLSGAGGHILVKTESGQLQLIRVAPQPTANAAGGAASAAGQPVTATAQVSGATVVVSAAAGTAALSTAQKQQTDTTKEKCRKFLANLLELSSREPKAVERNVRTLIQELIDAKVEPEEFCDRLEKLLNASPQPCLIGFLKKSLPLLRQSLFLRVMTIDGIRPPPQHVVTQTQQQIQIQVPAQQGQGQQVRPQVLSQTVRVVAPAHVAGQSINVTTPPRGVAQQCIVTPVRGQLGTKLVTAIRAPTATQPPSLHPTASAAVRVQSPKTIGPGAKATAIKTAGGTMVNVVPGKGGAAAGLKAVAVGMNAKGALMAASPSPAASQAAAQPTVRSLAKVVARGFESSSFGGDDDINDVAAMGGVNLAEESQRILGSTELIGTQIRSIKDELFLHSGPLQTRIRQIVASHGLEEVNSEVCSLVSHACQERLKTLVEKLACLAEHRIDAIRMNPRYDVTHDVKGQLKFLEELDRQERKRHEEQERELLLRAAKSRSKTEDPEQVKLKAKAKEMQRAEMEELRQREANITALQAIGPRKVPRLAGASSPSSMVTANSSGTTSGSSQEVAAGNFSSSFPRPLLRQRLKRVTVKDLLFLLEQEREPKRSKLLYKAYLK